MASTLLQSRGRRRARAGAAAARREALLRLLREGKG